MTEEQKEFEWARYFASDKGYMYCHHCNVNESNEILRKKLDALSYVYRYRPTKGLVWPED